MTTNQRHHSPHWPFSAKQNQTTTTTTKPTITTTTTTTTTTNTTLKLKTQSILFKKCDSSTAWLIYYFAFNLGLTIFNKRVLISFPFPWSLTAIHTLAGTIGTQIAHANGLFSAARLSRNHSLILIAFSILYTVNIAVSNLSLHLVTVPFHQVVRATTPLFTIILSIIYFNKSYPLQTYLSLLIVVLGVGLSTYGDYGWTLPGLLLTLLGTILASFKTVVTNVIQVGRLRLNPLDLLMRMSPLAFIQCILYAYLTGEMNRVHIFAQSHMDRRKLLALFVNGLIAFGLNVVSFTANKKTSALTMTVAGQHSSSSFFFPHINISTDSFLFLFFIFYSKIANVKQVLTILLAIIIFDLVITPLNLLGILITLIGGGYYAKIELERKYASKSPDVLIIPTSQFEPDDNNDERQHHHRHHHHHRKFYDDQGQARDDDDTEKSHPLQINSLHTKQRPFNPATASPRDLEEGSHPLLNDHPILKINSPR
ncbi:uncharacterized protein VP01_369g1 [Puccinia sorghi]|uniref:Sugar phosphate transporter domain-containing protein n=1 Tax=Puccinia sorghi TaxID=27349 RepID=A0A0L6UU72_9BASI|nr:uncharacterized protein VP01_369g1 [Puccinia sorghi]